MSLLEQIKPDAIKGKAPIPSHLVLQKQKGPGFWLTSVEGSAPEEFHLTLRPLPNEKPADTVRRLATVLREKGAAVVRHEIFGPNALHEETMQKLQQEIPGFNWPIMWIGNGKNAGHNISGMHVFAVTGADVDTINQNGEPIGRVFNDGLTYHCLLSGLKPTNRFESNTAQCQKVFGNLERALGEAGMDMADVARTWFFLDNIHSRYGEFNKARIEFFKERKLLNGLLPASTGIGSGNPAHAALVAGAWAVQSAKGSVSITELPSPMQCSSMKYGSAFSRAVLMDTPPCRRLLISGTASIGPGGRSLYAGDMRKQIALTMDVVQAILASRDFDFPDVTRTTAYFKNIQDKPMFDEWRKEHNLEYLPFVAVQADICRPELLFEIELDAIRVKPQPNDRQDVYS